MAETTVAVPLSYVDALPSPEDEQRELDAILTGETPMTETDLDVEASDLLRRMAVLDALIDRSKAACARETEQVHMRYAKRIDTLEDSRTRYAQAVEALALRAKFGPRAKSRSVGFGEYGIRKSKDRLVLRDIKAALAWAKEHAQELVRRKEDVTVKDLEDYYRNTSQLPAGCEFIEGKDEPFARPIKEIEA